MFLQTAQRTFIQKKLFKCIHSLKAYKKLIYFLHKQIIFKPILILHERFYKRFLSCYLRMFSSYRSIVRYTTFLRYPPPAIFGNPNSKTKTKFFDSSYLVPRPRQLICYDSFPAIIEF